MALDFHALLAPVPTTAKFEDPDHYIWCGSAVRGDDGLFYMYYSRWARSLGFEAWVSHSEVAFAVAESIFGPWRHAGVALPARGSAYWDGDCTHNPTVLRGVEDGRYYLYYMGTRGSSGGVREASSAERVHFSWEHRNNQRIGVAVAGSPRGPWLRMDAPLIDTTPGFYDALCCSNPTVTRRHKRHGGGCLMVYKTVNDRGAMPFGGPVLHCVAVSQSPAGPFVKQAEPVFVREGAHFAAEDPFIWAVQEGMESGADAEAPGPAYRAIVKDMGGYFTGRGRSLALFESEDGLAWNAAVHPFVSETEVMWQASAENGSDISAQATSHQRLIALERPQLFIDAGVPRALLCAAQDLGGGTFNVQIPVRWPNPM